MTRSPISFSIAIEAGGKSSRMGKDKGLIPFMRKPMFQHIIDQVAGLSEDVFIISNHPDRFPPTGYPIYGDKIPDIGALGGLHSALSYAREELCLVLACDMPIVNADLIQYLVREAEGADAVIPQLDRDMLEPFRAVYRNTCLAVIKEAIQNGERRAISFLPRVRTKFVERAELEAINPGLDTFMNINTPEELVQVETYALQQALKKKGEDAN